MFQSLLLLALCITPCITPQDKLEQNYQQQPTYKNAVALHQATKKPLLVLVGAKWCQFCPYAKQVAESIDWKKTNIIYVYIDYDQDVLLAKKIMGNVSGIPCFSLYQNNKKRSMGFVQTKDQLVQWVLRK